MTDGTGTRSYSYNAPFSLGALRPSQECFVATGSGPACTYSIAYGYDALGRLNARTVSGNGAETFAYDALGRLSEHDSDLGAFTLSYLGETGQPVLRKLGGAGATLETAWDYLPNSGDRRLASIGNTGLTSGQYSNFAFHTTPENQITGITETSDAPAVYPAAGTQTATYNAVNQLADLSGQAFTYDANGNLTSDGTRSYSWDADNRLIGIAYPATPGKATTFAYDGLGRRTTISHTPAGGGAVVATTYVWCGDKPCQARDASNEPQRAYYPEGERLLGNSPASLYYGVDQLGSVRRAFASPTSAPAYGYDPYGVPLQTTVPLTDFGYAGLITEPDSGLGLATYRAYDPKVGRWISRDPIGEVGDQAGTLYAYVGANPISSRDPAGLAGRMQCEALQIIQTECKGSVMRVFPGQYLNCTLQEIKDAAQGGDSAARTAWKLLNDNRFKNNVQEEGIKVKHALYELLGKLDDTNLPYTLSRHRGDTILVCVTFVGLRVEIDVFDDGHMEVCCFRGNEGVEGGVELIYRLIEGSADKP